MSNLITGGTGTLGQALAKQLRDVIIFSQSEQPQVEMKRQHPEYKYIVGNVRDYDAVLEATSGVKTIYHCAAIKHITICEEQPEEAIKTNVTGTLNVVRAAQKNGCKIVFMSTDKAEDPSCTYGMTKLMAEHFVRTSGLEHFILRSGNIFGSSGSVVPLFIKQIKETNCITLTNGEMTRFFILADDLAECLITNTEPTYLSVRMRDLAKAIKIKYGNKDTLIKEVGPRKGEKMHEILNGVSSNYKVADWTGVLYMLNRYDRV